MDDWADDSNWDDWSNYQLDSDGTWIECDLDNGYWADDDHTWINLKPKANADSAGQGASLLQQQAAVRSQDASTVGTSLIEHSRRVLRMVEDVAPQASTVLDTNGQPTQLNGGAVEFQWGTGK